MLRNASKFRLFMACSAGAIVGLSSSAMAQSTKSADTSGPVDTVDQDNAPADYTALGEIVVTARRREEVLQRVPVAVTALNDDMLTQNNIQQTTDLQKLVPGVVFSGAGTDANTTFSIRGQGKDVIGPGLPSVISYFNEVPLPGFGGVVPTYDMSSIQILKGPQGTLFGRNTTGGAVLLYSKAPTDQFGGYVQVTGGDYFWHAVQGALNVPITEGIALRVAGNVERRDGFTKNLGVGADFDELHNDAFRVSLKLNPTDYIENITVYDYFLKDAAYSSIVPVGSAPGAVPYNNGLFLAGIVGAENAALIDQSFNCNVSVECDVDLQIARQIEIGPRKVYSDVDAFDHTRVQGISNTTTIDIGAVTFKNIFGYRRVEVDQRGNTDGLPLSVLNTALTRNDEQFTNEIQVSGSLFEDQLEFLFGGFYLKTRPIGSTSLFTSFLRPASIPVDQWRLATVSNTLYRDDSRAVFGSLTYDAGSLINGLSVNGALRYTWDKQGVCARTLGGGSTPLQSTAACRAQPGAFDIDAKFEKLTWTFGVDYQLTPDVFTYAVLRRGYRSGGINSPLLAGGLSDLQAYDPQVVDDIELGVKTNWSAGALSGRLNVAAFRGKFKDLQRQISGIPPNIDGDNDPSTDPSSTALIINGADSTVQGIEIDGLVNTGGLTLNFGGSYIDAKYTDFFNPPILNGIAPAAGLFLNTPEFSYNVGGRYDLPFELSGTTFSIAADYYWVDDYRQGIVTTVPSYGVANARVGLHSIGDLPLDMTIFVENLFDKEYRRNASLTGPSPGVSTVSFGAPRMFGVRLRYSFGNEAY
ncbi:TonB-dependent receptor [Pacificimonas sp. ICDLI1SI03]